MKKLLQIFSLHLGIILALSYAFRLFIIFSLHKDGSLFQPLLTGIIFDFSMAVYSFLPWVIALLFLILIGKPLKRVFSTILFLDIGFFILMLLSEYFFFDEFTDRFNFIAVDYLVYTGEVFKNIWESYPIIPLIAGLCLLSAILTFALTRIFHKEPAQIKRKNALIFTAIYSMVFLATLQGVTERKLITQFSSYEQTIAKNGMHALFAAYRNNEIDFERFYTNMDIQKAQKILSAELKNGYIVPKTSTESPSILRRISTSKAPKGHNIVLVLMESMSARFMNSFGNTKNLTPNLDRFGKEGIFFSRAYATGTRTVRGIEATTLSIPPTPGQSIVRRPGGIGLYNIGTIFRERGYKTSFIYGGRAIFDNMKSFFSGNGFEIEDQSSFPKNEIGFSNAWGVSDEDLFRQAIKSADQSHSKKIKFFQYILNTTNHRPYTYPSGRIDIPSGTGREGAVKYADYAIGKFIEEARKKEWFKDTIFIFVADHNASVSGGTDILPSDFLIPMIFYAPNILKPKRIDSLISQIDLAPSLAGLMNFSYSSSFFGTDVFLTDPKRAFVGTYQKVALLKEDSLVILSPNQTTEICDNALPRPKIIDTIKINSADETPHPNLREAVAYFKTASHMFIHELLKEGKIKTNINIREY